MSRRRAGRRRAASGPRSTRCPDDQRKTIELAYFGGFSHSQIAELLNEPIGTVKGRMRLGLEKMRRQLVGGLRSGGNCMNDSRPHQLQRRDRRLPAGSAHRSGAPGVRAAPREVRRMPRGGGAPAPGRRSPAALGRAGRAAARPEGLDHGGGGARGAGAPPARPPGVRARAVRAQAGRVRPALAAAPRSRWACWPASAWRSSAATTGARLAAVDETGCPRPAAQRRGRGRRGEGDAPARSGLAGRRPGSVYKAWVSSAASRVRAPSRPSWADGDGSADVPVPEGQSRGGRPVLVTPRADAQAPSRPASRPSSTVPA